MINLKDIMDESDFNSDKIEKLMEPYIEQMKEFDRAYTERLKTVNPDKEIQNIIQNLNGWYTTNNDEDYVYQTIIENTIEDKIEKYFELETLLKRDLFEVTCYLPYSEYLYENGELGSEIMFMEWFIPIRVTDKKYILSRISGQGESFIVIRALSDYTKDDDKTNNGFNAVKKWYDINEILN